MRRSACTVTLWGTLPSRDSSFKTTARRETLRLMEFGLVCRPYRPCFAKGSIPHQVVGTLWVTPCWGPVHLVRCSGKAWVLPRVQKNNGRHVISWEPKMSWASVHFPSLMPMIHHRFTTDSPRCFADPRHIKARRRVPSVWVWYCVACGQGLTVWLLRWKTVEKSWESSFNWLVCPIIHHYSRKSRDVNVNFLRSSSCIHLRLF